MKQFRAFAFALAAVVFFTNPAFAQLSGDPFAYGVVQVLDKVTTHRQAVAIPAGKTVTMGTIRVLVRSCYKSAADEKPEAAAFIEVYDLKRPDKKDPIFQGWMFKSAPSLSVLEHAIYDVTVLDCSNSISQ